MFAENLNRILKEKSISHYRLAQITGIGHDSMSLYRNGKREPKHENLIKIADALCVSVDKLIRGANDDRMPSRV